MAAGSLSSRSSLNCLRFLLSFFIIIALHARVISSKPSSSSEYQKHVMVIHIQEITDDQGGDLHTLGQLQAYLRLHYKVTYLYLLDYKKDYDRSKFVNLEELGITVIDGTSGAKDATTTVKVKELLLQNKYEAVIEFLWGTPDYLAYLRDINEQIKDLSPSTAIGVLNADVFHQRMLKEHGGDVNKCPSCEEYRKVELYFWQNADVVIGVNDDINLQTRKIFPHANVVLLPYCELVEKAEISVSWEKRTGIIYYGHNNTANAASAQWLILHVAPKLLETHKAYLNIYGKVPAEGCELSRGCISHGPTDAKTLNRAIISAKWMVAPIFTNVGISTKILRALGLGTPVITTQEGRGGKSCTLYLSFRFYFPSSLLPTAYISYFYLLYSLSNWRFLSYFLLFYIPTLAPCARRVSLRLIAYSCRYGDGERPTSYGHRVP